ncbi:3-hydroxyacyl-CoA dehydrogenase [Undibacterium sp. Di26W]|uniref:3-hydroxyacyl-CoA dehydrogenase n=1 Tax=Undibacterium sp. Di26W TaxID=3413035 RepID=UPI003BF1B4B0
MKASIGVVGIVGAGAMGRGIGQIAAQAGFAVLLFDVQPDAARKANQLIAEQWQKMLNKEKLTEEEYQDALENLQVVDDMQELADCDLIVEAIVEKLDAKRGLFQQLDGIVSDACILATNTSSLSVTAIAAGSKIPERVAGLHFFNPVPLMKVVEVIDGLLTSADVAGQLMAFASRTGHLPVRARDTPGFIVNHAGRAYGTEALRILQENVATFRQIDQIMREAAGFKLGPFELMDLTGLDVSHPVMEAIYHQYYEEPRYRPSVITAQRVHAGVLGRKTGRGFYSYSTENTLPAPVENYPAWTDTVWISQANPDAVPALTALFERCGASVETGAQPSDTALCIVSPYGTDVSSSVASEGLDARRTLGIDALLVCEGHLTLMTNPATDALIAARCQSLLLGSGQGVSLIQDSSGFVVQRMLACIINIASDIVQQGICSPQDLDRAVTLGLAYPVGPLAWGDKLGASRILGILRNLLSSTGDPRYRPSPWLVRRAQLGLSLLHTEKHTAN